MADYKLIGKDYSTPDLVAKVTGRAKYAEDFRAEGMLFAKLFLSPMPHARVRSIDASAALAMPGVEALLTADDLPEAEAPNEAGMTNEPLYEGEPILAVAAVDELTAAEAVERIQVDLEPLPFCLDPLDSLRPGGPDARLDGNTVVDGEMTTLKWTDADFTGLSEGRLPMGEATDEWEFGNVEAGFADADLVLDETIFHQSLSHQPLETRTTMAYWQNGKAYVYPSVQTIARSLGPIARAAGVSPNDVVLINEYTGGGFGSKGRGYPQLVFPILLAKKTGKPVMMRVTRRDENFFGRSRPGIQGRVKIGFRPDGRITALDLFTIQDGGPYGRQGDFLTVGRIASLTYQPLSMRARGVTVFTNTPPRGAQRAPGGAQSIAMLSPVLDKAARQLGIDRAEILRINAPEGQAEYNERDGSRTNASSAFVKEAIDKGVELFGWRERQARSGQRHGSRVTGTGVAVSSYSGGSTGHDGLMILKPDGRLSIHTGIGNLGTESFADCSRAGAEAIDMPWEQVHIVWGDTSKHLPWSSSQGGSQTTHAHTRANWAAGQDAKRKLQEVAALDLGGSPDDYELGGERVYRRGNRSQGMTYARAAQRAIERGGRFDGHELPGDINSMTVASARALAGQGLMGIAKDNYGVGGRTMSFVVGFAEVEIDIETGEIKLVDYVATTDCGTVLHPASLGGQILGGGIQGFGIALNQKWVYDRRWGLLVAKKFYSNRPPGILDIPLAQAMKWAAVDEPDPFTPVGSKGIGEPPVGAATGAVVCAIADAMRAVGDGYFHRTPVSRDMILTELEHLPAAHGRLTTHV